jgi:biotin carboxyl carrier protein
MRAPGPNPKPEALLTRTSPTLLALLIVCVAACSDGEGAVKPESDGERAEAQEPARASFEGYIVPTNATLLRAPQNTFRINGWNSSSSWIKLQNLVEDGKQVKEGEVVAWFEFRGREALPRVREGIDRAEANRDRSGLDVESQIQQMETSELQKELDAKRAELDTLKKGVVSDRDLARFQIAKKQAEFEADAQNKTLGAYRRSVRAEAAFHDKSVERANADMDRYRTYEERFKVKAPHDGVVRHAFMKRRRRKVQKGDGMASGRHFMSVARDDELSIEFYIPESRYPLTRSQKRWVVRAPSSGESYPVEVAEVEEFPQELGFLKEDENLPNAREKMYVVHARFLEQPKALSAGLEVEVSLP